MARNLVGTPGSIIAHMGIVRAPLVGVLLALAALSTAQPSAALPTEVKVGGPAPKLSVSKWVKGTPVKEFEKGKLYVVEFWATWCGPCKTSIPHLSKLQAKYKDKVQFVGVSIWENKPEDVDPFVKEMGDQMNYAVAMDEMPSANAKPDEGFMAKNWMEAAKQMGIPSAFIIDGEGRVAWIGHPMEMDDPLAKVVEGTWSFDEFAKLQAEKELVSALMQKYSAAMRDNKIDAALEACDEMVKAGAPEQAMFSRLNALVLFKKDFEAAEKYGKEAVESVFKDDWNTLNSLAWMVVDPKGTCEKKNLNYALAAAKRSVELDKNWANLDTLARAHFIHGDKAKAIELQKEALSLAPDEDSKKELQATLDEYTKV